MKKYIVCVFISFASLCYGQGYQKMVETIEQKNQKCLDSGVDMLGCSQKYIIQSDSVLNKIYGFVRKELSYQQKQELKKEQLLWLKKRDSIFNKIEEPTEGLDDKMIANQDRGDFINDRSSYLLNSFIKKATHQNTIGFIPSGYRLFDEAYGDLNQDGLIDCILLIKATGKNKHVKNNHNEIVDRNRRGVLVLMNKGNGLYQLVVRNDDCFSSENEDGGVYFAPELEVYIENNKLFIHYSHGRYGFWKYQFRAKASDFELIGYDAVYGGAVVKTQTSINFLSKRKLYQVNQNENDEGGDEMLKDTWFTIKYDKRILLSEINDFDALDMFSY